MTPSVMIGPPPIYQNFPKISVHIQSFPVLSTLTAKTTELRRLPKKTR
jgi:hypothetical protein